MDRPGISIQEDQLMRRFLATIVLLGAAAVAVWVVRGIAIENYKPLLFFLVGVSGMFLWFVENRWFWPAVVAALFLQGRLQFIPGGFTLFQVALGFGILRFAVDVLVFKKGRIRGGPKLDQWLIWIFVGILLYHGFSNKFGLRVLGSDIWGGRGYIIILNALLAYYVIQSLPYDGKAWRMLPFVIFLPLGFDLFIQTVTYLVPALVNPIWRFYTGVSLAGMEEFDTTERVGAWGGVAIMLATLTVSFFRISEIWRPERVLGLLGVLASVGAALYSGFRSALFAVGLTFVIACWRDLRGKSMFVGILGLLALVTLPMIHTGLFPLPKQAQRALSFMPGDWDPAMVKDAQGSLEFRQGIKDLWWEKYQPQYPWFGRGFGFDPRWADFSIERGGRSYDFYDKLIITGNFHNGVLAVLDGVGIIGGIAIFAWTMIVLWRAWRYLTTVPFTQQHPALRWVTLYLVVHLISSWLGGMTIALLVEPTFVLGALLLHLITGEKEEAAAQQLAEAKAARAPGAAARRPQRPQRPQITFR
jgi:hypothetical protein